MVQCVVVQLCCMVMTALYLFFVLLYIRNDSLLFFCYLQVIADRDYGIGEQVKFWRIFSPYFIMVG